MPLLTSCDLPQVSAEDRLFLNLSVDFLGDYQLPKQPFKGTRVGGLSGITYDRQRDRFYALSDDRSDFAPARFYTLKLDLDSTKAEALRIKQVAIESVTTILGEDGKPYPQGTIDPEGIALSPLETVFISSEGVTKDGIPPFVREFDLRTGQWKRSLQVPKRYSPETTDDQPPQGVQDNLGFESLTIASGNYGKTAVEPFRLFAATESALTQDVSAADPTQGAKNRLLHYLLEARRALLLSEHLYQLDPPPEGAISHGLTELLAIDQGGHFLSLERSFGLEGFQVKLFQLALGSATDISSFDTVKNTSRSTVAIPKKLLLDLSSLNVPLDNLEGMTIGPRLPDGSRSLLLVSDDNFRQEQVTQFLLFRLKGLA
ncbi:esterase-like activity of phytase family protein [Phormidium sp. FACHB-592]|uniref:Esterase-like activity of phytase family protein n=1 Tax=Stenomitos frigidus AS-A4 TaxID=2933935 RepID=A0ABV0KGE1_9CYAN|nr:esterase-like activity of phytase family protein [Phormidium sp. FACHB-592]MBD2078136.1 esterase-like activity of phytase family protein [Phormidium sp. FACHB-592]